VDAIGFLDGVEGDDVRVIQGRDGAGFSLEAREAIGIASHFRRKDFERYGAAELGVHGAIDFAHAAGADGSGDFVMGKRAADQGAPPGCRADGGWDFIAQRMLGRFYTQRQLWEGGLEEDAKSNRRKFFDCLIIRSTGGS
jgi:hypothetical protein